MNGVYKNRKRSLSIAVTEMVQAKLVDMFSLDGLQWR